MEGNQQPKSDGNEGAAGGSPPFIRPRPHSLPHLPPANSLWKQFFFDVHNTGCIIDNLTQRAFFLIINQELNDLVKFQRLCALKKENTHFLQKILQLTHAAAVMAHRPHPIFLEISRIHYLAQSTHMCLEIERVRLQRVLEIQRPDLTINSSW